MSDTSGRKVAIAAKVPADVRRRIRAAAECEGISASKLIGRAAERAANRLLVGRGVAGEIEAIIRPGEES